jgi:nitrate reductase NapAB chaperone NapD
VEVETVVVVVVAALHRMRVPEMTKELEVVDTYSLVLHSADGRLVVVVVEMLND